VFDHVMIRAGDREASERFYDTVLQPLGIEISYSDDRFAEWDDFTLTGADPAQPGHAWAARGLRRELARARRRLLACRH
jgi:catechol 2,3-dioxygenase-like lactoylglutathione lyase family enzyme